MDPVAIGFATTGATVLLTVILFGLDRYLRRRASQQEVRRQLMMRVLDTFELATRSLVRPAFVQAWTNVDVEYAMLLPRLLLDLGKRDRVIAVWLQKQVQLMQLEPSHRRALAIRGDVAVKLLQWQQLDLERSWFENEVRASPPTQPFIVPRKVKLTRLAHDGWAWAQLLAVLAAVSAMFRQATKS
jgi:hypothetical protein